MSNRKLIYTILGIGIITSLILAMIIFHLKNNQELKVVFLDVGQGDAILIESGSNQIVIDGGRDENVLLERLGEFMPFWDRTIEAVIITHPDSDHFGGIIGALKNYQVKSVIKTNAESHSQLWKKLKNIIGERNIQQVVAKSGLEIVFPNSAKILTLFPFGDVPKYPKNTNETSIVARLKYGKNSFLFTGDLPSNKEEELLKAGINVQSDVLKIGHHGSKFSTSDNFLKAVNPEDAIISVGKNRYGHPTEEVLKKLKRRLIRIWRTDQDGNIVYQCQAINQDCKVFSD